MGMEYQVALNSSVGVVDVAILMSASVYPLLLATRTVRSIEKITGELDPIQ